MDNDILSEDVDEPLHSSFNNLVTIPELHYIPARYVPDYIIRVYIIQVQ